MDVKTLCLGVLSRGDATGYEIRKLCEDGPFAHFHTAGFGSIYPALAALHQDGCISVREVSEAHRPARKVYSITASGRLVLTDALTRPPVPDRLRSDFLFIAFFGHLLSTRHVDALLGERIEMLRTRVYEMRVQQREVRSGGEAFTLGYAIATHEAAADYLDAHRHELVGAALRNEMDEGKRRKQKPPKRTSPKRTAAKRTPAKPT